MPVKGKHSQVHRRPRWPLLLLVILLGAAAFLWLNRGPEEAEPVSAPVPPEEMAADEPALPPEPEPELPPEPEAAPDPLEALRPDAPNHPGFPSQRLNPGEEYIRKIRFEFA